MSRFAFVHGWETVMDYRNALQDATGDNWSVSESGESRLKFSAIHIDQLNDGTPFKCKFSAYLSASDFIILPAKKWAAGVVESIVQPKLRTVLGK